MRHETLGRSSTLKCCSLRRLAATLAAGLILTACSGQDPEALTASAEVAMAKSDTAGAKIKLMSALASKPDLARARFLLGQVLLQERAPGLAAIEFAKARQLGIPVALVAPLEARALVEQGQWPAIIERYGSQPISDAGAQADVQVALATAYASLGQMDKARKELSLALAARPEHLQGQLLQARFNLASGDAQGAMEQVDRVLVAHPRDPDALQLKGDLLLPKQPREAVALYRQVLEIDKRHIPSLTGIMQALAETEAASELEAHVTVMRAALGDAPLVDFADARLALIVGDLPKAKAQIEKVLRIGNDNAEVLTLAGAIALKSKSLIQAETFLTKAVGVQPQSQIAKTLLASTYLGQNQPRRALEVLSTLQRRDGLLPQTMAVWGLAYLLSGDYAKAEEMYRRALAVQPGDIQLETAAATVRIRRGDIEGGLRTLDGLSSAQEKTLPEMAALSERLRLQDYAGALANIDRLERKVGQAAWVSNLRGRTLLQAGRIEDSALAFDKALAAEPSNFESAAGKAGILLAQGRPAEAKAVFGRMIELQPNDYRAHLALADTALRAGDAPPEIRKSIDRAVALNPDGRDPKISLIEYLLRQRDHDAALAAAQSANSAFPDDPELINLLGRSQLGTKNIQQAMVSFNRLVALAPESPLGYVGLADCQVAQRNTGAAIANLRKALQLSPGLETAQIGIVTLEAAAGRLDAALIMAKQMQRERPESGLGYLYEGDLAALRKDEAAAAAAYREGLRHQPLTELASKFFVSLHRRGKADEAAAFVKQWTSDHPRDAAFHFVVADRAMSAGDRVAAEMHFGKGVEIKPDDPAARNNLAWLMTQRRDGGALVHAQRAAELWPTNPQVQDTLAAALTLSGQLPDAIGAQRRAVELAPQDGDLRLTLARLLLQTGDKAAAGVELQQLTRLGGRFPKQAEVQALLASLR